jgi:hypothetical protein
MDPLALSKYINDVAVFHLKYVVNRKNKTTTKISVAIEGIFERYMYNITQQDDPHKDKKPV